VCSLYDLVSIPCERKIGKCGPSSRNALVRIVDENGKDLPPGQIGEIWACGKSICSGFFDDPGCVKTPWCSYDSRVILAGGIDEALR
jgi:hypothetical protein